MSHAAIQNKATAYLCKNLYIDGPDICENCHVAVAINTKQLSETRLMRIILFFLSWLQRHDLADHTLLLIMAPMDEMCVFGNSAFFSLYDKSALSS